MFDPAQPSIAVAYIVDSQGRLLLTWNEKWGAFTLPMTKVHSDQPAESPEQAAIRAAAEVLAVPTRVVVDKETKFARGLQKSPRDGDIKDYQYNVVPVEAHPDFASQVSSKPLLWATIAKLQNGDYQPVSKSVEAILQECAQWGWI